MPVSDTSFETGVSHWPELAEQSRLSLPANLKDLASPPELGLQMGAAILNMSMWVLVPKVGAWASKASSLLEATPSARYV